MSQQKVAILFLGLCAILGAAAFFGLTPFGRVMVQQVAGVGSAVGTTFNTAKVAQINLSPTNGATSTSILNTDTSDRYVLDNFVGCSNATTTYTAVTGAGLPALGWIIKAATTSTNAPAVVSNTNLAMNIAIATGTTAAGTAGYGDVLAASSSIATSTNTFVNNAGAAAFVFRWAAGSYLTFFSNATNTAACTVGVHYISS